MPKDQPATCEVAVTEEATVAINYRCATCGKEGHLAFTPEQGKIFLEVFQTALIQARQRRRQMN